MFRRGYFRSFLYLRGRFSEYPYLIPICCLIRHHLSVLDLEIFPQQSTQWKSTLYPPS